MWIKSGVELNKSNSAHLFFKTILLQDQNHCKFSSNLVVSFAQQGSLLLSSLDTLIETDLSRIEKPLSRNKTEMLSTHGIISPWNGWCWSYMQVETLSMRKSSDEWPHESALLSSFLVPWALHGQRYNSTAPCPLHRGTHKHCLSRNEQHLSAIFCDNAA